MQQNKRIITGQDMGYHIATEMHGSHADITVRENGVLLGRFFNRTEANKWIEDRESAIRNARISV